MVEDVPAHGWQQARLQNRYLRRKPGADCFTASETPMPAAALRVFDEAHALKNRCPTNAAAAAFCRRVATETRSSGSRVLLLSATPFDKQSHSKNLCSQVGIHLSSARLDLMRLLGVSAAADVSTSRGCSGACRT